MRTETMTATATNNQFFSREGFIPPPFPPRRLLSLPPSETTQKNNSESPSLWQRIENIFHRNQNTEETQEHHPPSPTASEGAQSYFRENLSPDNHGVPTVNHGQHVINNHPTAVQEYHETRGLLMNVLAPENFGSYIRNAFYLILLSLFVYAIIILYEDIMNKKANELKEIYAHIKKCEQDYIDNKCDRGSPALREECFKYEKCMNLDPMTELQISKISVDIIGGAITEFAEKLSVWATGVFLVVFFLIIKYGVNSSTRSHQAMHDFRTTQEYDEFQARLHRIERLSAQKQKHRKKHH